MCWLPSMPTICRCTGSRRSTSARAWNWIVRRWPIGWAERAERCSRWWMQGRRMCWARRNCTARGERPAGHLQNYSGILQADGYAGFNKLYETGRIVEAACSAHARRKFHDLYQAHRSPIAQEALERIGQLYGIEQEIRGRSPAERREVRQARSRPLLEAMHVWLKAMVGKLSQKSDVAVAIRYALDRWTALRRFCEDGRIEMDNN